MIVSETQGSQRTGFARLGKRIGDTGLDPGRYDAPSGVETSRKIAACTTGTR